MTVIDGTQDNRARMGRVISIPYGYGPHHCISLIYFVNGIYESITINAK